VKKSNKKFKIFCVTIIICNHYFIFSGSYWLYSVSNKTNGIKIRLQLYNFWQIHGHQLNWRIVNSKAPLSYLGL